MSHSEDLRQRTRNFAIRIVRLFRALPKSSEAKVMGKQFLRCGTSVAANYRAVCRARSKAEFVAKLSIVVEEMDETLFWVEFIGDLNLIRPARLARLSDEANQLTAIFVASRKTSRGVR